MSIHEPLLQGAAAEARNNPVNAKLFPLDKEVMIEVAQPVSAAGLVGLCTCLVLASQGVNENTDAHVVVALNTILFVYLPIGLAGLLVSVAVKKKPDLVGLSSGFLLVNFLLPTLIGAVVSVVKSGESVGIVAGVAVVTLALTVFGWSRLCCYPKFLHYGRDIADGERDAALPTGIANNGAQCPACRSPTIRETGRAVNEAGDGEDKCEACGGVQVAEV